MGDMAIMQPNGHYARFSTVVDNFTHYNCTREELYSVFYEMHGCSIAVEKMKKVEWCLHEFNDAIETIEMVHGKKEAEKKVYLLSERIQI